VVDSTTDDFVFVVVDCRALVCVPPAVYSRAMPTGSSLTAVLTAIYAEAIGQGTPLLLLAFLLTALVLRGRGGDQDLRSRRRVITFLLGLHVLLLPITGLCAALQAEVVRELRLIGAVAGAIAGVGMAGLLVFGAALRRMRVTVPRILQDVIVAGFGIIALFGAASRAGVNLSGIVATGAVLTAVIGLALQDTLGNLVGGLALQLDSTVRVGDWIRVQDVSGRVTEIRWRSTSIETRNWETVVIPNSVLTRSQVTVMGRRSGEAPRWRRIVAFQVDYRYAPTLVIETVLKALRAHPIENVAEAPVPSCVLMEFGDSAARYMVRYFLLDFAADDPTDSVVRTRIYYALTRAGIPLAIPAHTVFMTEDSLERRERKRELDIERRLAALQRIALFANLSEQERLQLAQALHHAPFAPGEVLTREGAEAHHLYVIDSGRVSVRVGAPGHEREVAQLHEGEFFGEMSLLTGEKRSATVVALSDTQCYRLDADAFRQVLARRPDLAEQVASELAARRNALLATRAELDPRQGHKSVDKNDLVKQIRSFFGL
jgi:small-conductance mechanosensitive channel